MLLSERGCYAAIIRSSIAVVVRIFYFDDQYLLAVRDVVFPGSGVDRQI